MTQFSCLVFEALLAKKYSFFWYSGCFLRWRLSLPAWRNDFVHPLIPHTWGFVFFQILLQRKALGAVGALQRLEFLDFGACFLLACPWNLYMKLLVPLERKFRSESLLACVALKDPNLFCSRLTILRKSLIGMWLFICLKNNFALSVLADDSLIQHFLASFYFINIKHFENWCLNPQFCTIEKTKVKIK